VRIGFIGLGKMGRPMVRNLLKAGYEVVVHNRSRPPVDELAAEGAVPATSPVDVARQVDVVITSLPDPPTVRQVYLGPQGIMEAKKAGQLWVDTSTVDPETSRTIAEAARGIGAAFLDAPVSGGPPGAEAATLTIMVGGDREAFDRALPVFEKLGKNIHYCGPSGSGTIVKLVNQLLVGINMAGVAEALVFAAKAGVDPAVAFEVIKTSYGGSMMWTRSTPLILQRDFTPRTPVGLLCKDLDLITRLAARISTRLLMGAQAEQVFQEAKALGFGDSDMAALVLPLERVAGVEVRPGQASAGA
jgi:3-hydroxyisobutyrate dehydrogenase